MKYKLTFAFVASLTSTAFAEFKAPLPEFKNEKQLAEWRAEKASESTSQGYATEQTAFYTGKPYLASSGEYAFKYRSYNPELSRWTSEDPSGFPDGLNNHIYAPNPTSDFDFEGLLKWSTLNNLNATISWTHNGNSLVSDLWAVETNDGSAIINLRKDTRSAGGIPPWNSDYSYNCHGYTFGNSQYWINGQVDAILKGDGFKLITGDDKSKAKIAYWGNDVHTAVVNTVSGGVVTQVTGKLGAKALKTSSPADQGYSGTIEYYE